MTTFTAMPKYEVYKDSGVDWLGEIPSGWSVQRIKHETELLTGFPFSSAKYSESGIKLVRGINVKEGRIDWGDTVFWPEITPDLKKYELHAGDILIGMDGSKVGKNVCQVDNKDLPLLLLQRVARIRAKQQILSSFLYWCFLNRSFLDWISKSKTDPMIPHIAPSDINDYVIAFPDISTQVKIANFLDEKTVKIDEAIAIKEKQIELLKERKKIIIQQAVTQGLDQTVPMKDSGVEWIGLIPAHWDIRKFKFLANVRYGLGQPPKQLDDGLKIIRATNVERGKIVENGMMYIDPNDVPWDRNPTLKHGEIIVVRSGAYTGDSALVTKDYDGCIAGYDMVATPIACSSEFLAYALLSHYVLYEQIYLMRMRSAQPHLNAEELNEILIALPPNDEQLKISRYIDRTDKEISTSLQIIQKQIEKLQEYKTTLINSAVTGKIKVV
jgi:restriction endonuclease S subunit